MAHQGYPANPRLKFGKDLEDIDLLRWVMFVPSHHPNFVVILKAYSHPVVLFILHLSCLVEWNHFDFDYFLKYLLLAENRLAFQNRSLEFLALLKMVSPLRLPPVN